MLSCRLSCNASRLLAALLFATCFLCLAQVAQTSLAQHNHDEETTKVDRSVDKNRSSIQEEGLNSNAPDMFAIVGATVHRSPSADPKIETVLVQGTKIVAIGDSKIPAGTQEIDASGKHLYAGLIDAYSGHSFDFDPDKNGTGYWNNKVTPQLKTAELLSLDKLDVDKYRKAGFTSALVAPDSGVVQGQSCFVLLGDYAAENSILKSNISQHFRLTVSRGRGQGYPNSPMGAYALARQSLYDAQWYQQAWQAAKADPTLPRPETNTALANLENTINGDQMAMIEASNELFAIRTNRFSKEFGLKLTILGSGNEYRRIDEIAALGRPIVLPVNFPKAPDVSSAETANDVSLESLMHWDHAPENPKRLAEKGVTFAFTTKGLKDKNDFLKHVRTAVKRGLPPKTALAAMTTNAAKLFGVEDQVGTVAKGKIANVIITDGDIFAEKTKIVETWVDGVRFQAEHEHLREVEGQWNLKAKGFSNYSLVVKENKHVLSGEIVSQTVLAERKSKKKAASKDDTEKSESKSETPDSKEKKDQTVKVKPISITGTRLTGAFRTDEFGHKGISLFSLIVSDENSATGQLTLPNGKSIPFSASLEESEKAESKTGDAKVTTKSESTDADAADSKETNKPTTKKESLAASFPVNYPLGAYGRTELPAQPKTVLVKNVFVWTLTEQGNLENAAVLFGDGVIKSIHPSGEVLPTADIVIDGKGAHLTPGVIDCHSHMATDSGVNESGQAITAEVRIGDMIDCDDMTIYRQLAGGVTTANVLHGSANPIGGQNQVIKLRWGANESEMKFEGAPEGIKFALGENVKQSNWDNPSGRYPQTRMGVEQIMDDAFRAAIDYKKSRASWEKDRKGLPPRRNLELDAIAEIIDGNRWIHCHSYRQDEILALMRTLESHDVTIGTFQHILEGYKVADRMAQHGAMASAFADWWAYKYEVKDAIPYAGALMHQAGVVVSFNSDDGELGRHLNHEAAKAVRYGGVSEIEALKFVTLNPARQLRIDDRVGSIAVGKDADIVLWTGHPLSNFSKVKQTWIDGRKYFDREEDAKTQETVRNQRLALIQKVLESGEEMVKPNINTIDPARLWPRHDEFCGHHHHHEDGHD
ncbi:MAG: amidohydrolase family protein [Mariniblastus sp.]